MIIITYYWLQLPTAMVLPEHNTRIILTLSEKEEQGLWRAESRLLILQPTVESESDSDDDDFISRDSIKRNAQSLIDSKTKKKKPSKKKKGAAH